MSASEHRRYESDIPSRPAAYQTHSNGLYLYQDPQPQTQSLFFESHEYQKPNHATQHAETQQRPPLEETLFAEYDASHQLPQAEIIPEQLADPTMSYQQYSQGEYLEMAGIIRTSAPNNRTHTAENV